MVKNHGVVRDFIPTLLTVETDECVLWPYSLDRKGYGQFNTKGRVRRVHNWVCRQIYGDPFPGLTDAAHSCGNRNCVNKRHLRWSSRKDNAAEGKNHTNDQRGEQNKMAKLTDDDVRAIRRARASQAKIAARYGVSQTTISKIKRREKWAHV